MSDFATRPSLPRRTLLGAVGIGALGIAFAGPGTARALAAYTRYDTREAYEQAWANVSLPFDNNESGGFAWGYSYTLLSLVRMWQATGDTLYLDRFVETADFVWSRTDKARKVTDYRGRSERVWRAGNTYTAAGAVIKDAGGKALFEIRYAGVTPYNASVTVANVSGGRFDLTLLHPTTGTITLTGVTLDPASPDYVVTRVRTDAYLPTRLWTAKVYDSTGTPTAGTTQLETRWYVFAIHTGMITYPIAMFSRVVIEAGQRLARYRGSAQKYLTWVRQAVAFHDDEFHYRTLPDGTVGGDYVWPLGAPVSGDGTIQPFNQSHGLGQTMAELSRIRGGDYGNKVSAMINSWLSDVELDGNAYQWHYWPTYSQLGRGYEYDPTISTYSPAYPASTAYEDLSHAAITVEMVVAAYRAGLPVDEAVLRHLAATYTDHLIVNDSQVNYRVNGTQLSNNSNAMQTGRWIPLEPFATRSIADHVEGLYEAIRFNPNQGSHQLAIAYLVWARAQGWTKD